MDDILGKIKRKLLRKYPAFGSITANLEFVVDDNIYSNGQPTYGTDGKRVAFHSERLAKMSESEILYAGAHEIGHLALNHIYRSEGKNPKLWNIACDAVLNQLLKEDGIEIPEGSIDYEDAKGYNVEDYYDKLVQQQKQDSPSQNDEQGKGQSNDTDKSQKNLDGSSSQSSDNKPNDNTEENSSDGSSSNEKQEESDKQDVGHDTHNMWDDAINERKEQEKKNAESKDSKTEKQEEKSVDDQKAFEDNATLRQQQLAELMKELSKTASKPGTTTNKDLINLNGIGTAKPLVEWRYLLKEALALDVDWSYQNAEIEYGVITPQLEAYSQPETEILLDTSESITHTLLRNFLRECKNILQQSRVKVGCFDTEFYGWNEIRTLEDIDCLEYVGGGGTDFNTAVKAFTKRVENKIIFTDGDAYMPNTAIDAVWVVFGDKKITPAGGKVIHITDDQLIKLCYENEQKDNHRRMK